MKTTAMVLENFRSPLVQKEFEVPALKEGQILVKMEAAGVCGSDVHMWKGEDERTPLPIILGHEGVGRVAAVKGKRTGVRGESLAEGDLILWNRGITCGKCYYCKVLNEPSLCTARKVYGINRSCAEEPYLNGCYARHLILTENTDIFKIETPVDPAILVSASCSGATVAHAFDMVSPSVGDTVVIQGPGPLGVFAVAFARSLGASDIIVIGGSENRLEICREFGADLTLNRRTTTVEERRQMVLDRTGGRGADIVVEAVGAPEVVNEGIDLLRMSGCYLTTGFAQFLGHSTLDFYKNVVRKNLRIQGVWVSDTRHTWQAMQLVLKQPSMFEKMITHRFSLEDANRALEAMDSRNALKAVLHYL